MELENFESCFECLLFSFQTKLRNTIQQNLQAIVKKRRYKNKKINNSNIIHSTKILSTTIHIGMCCK